MVNVIYNFTEMYPFNILISNISVVNDTMVKTIDLKGRTFKRCV